MKTRILFFIVGAILSIAACIKLAVISGLISHDGQWLQQIVNAVEPYFAPLLILVIGIILIYRGTQTKE